MVDCRYSFKYSLVVGIHLLLPFLLLTGSHNLLNYAIIYLVNKKIEITTNTRNTPQNWAFPGKKEQIITMIKVLFICHGKRGTF